MSIPSVSLRHEFLSDRNRTIMLPVNVTGIIINHGVELTSCITGNNALSTPSARQSTSISDADNGSSSNSRDAGRRRRRRWKRSHSRERHVEALVAVDVEMRRYHGHNLEHYILTLMAIVNI